MAREDNQLDIHNVDSTGTEITYTPIGADGVQFTNRGDVFILLQNNSGAGIEATIQTNKTVNGDLTVPDRTRNIPNGETVCMGTFNRSVYNQVERQVYVDGDGLEIAALKLS